MRNASSDDDAFLAGGGELGALIRSCDWSRTPLGPPDGWSRGLRTAVRIMLTARQAMWIGWGPELTFLYNDAYKPIIGGKHPGALGQPTLVVWREIWSEIGPRLEHVVSANEGTYDEALLLVMERYGYPEETYYTFSYSPIPDDEGGTGGVFCANTDDTDRVVRERQLALLRHLAAEVTDARTLADALRLSAGALETNPRDLPFALIYVPSARPGQLMLAATAGIAPGHPAAPTDVAREARTPWPLGEVMASRAAQVVPLQDAGALPSGTWDRPPSQAIAMPLPAHGVEESAGVLIVGLNPYRLLDPNYRGFLDLLTAEVTAGLASARAYEETRLMAERLAEIDRAKTVFLSNVSHEFRTPLTLIVSPLDDLIAADDEEPIAVHRDQLRVMRRNGQRLLRLVNTLLEFSRIEAGRVQAKYEPTDLAAFTADLASVFRSAVEKSGMELRIDCPPLPEPVFVDWAMWEQIVLNLVSNAFKFTFEGAIVVSLRASGRGAVMSVRDTGIGIAANEVPRLFNRFQRVDGARGRTQEGTGVGLALVQELVKLHGGQVNVASTPGSGTEFTVEIPFGTAHLPQDQVSLTAAASRSTPGAASYAEEALRWVPPAPEAERPTPSGRYRVVVADDNADMRQYVRGLLASSYDVVTVADGEEALRVVHETMPDLVVADVMLPRLDGFGLLRALRADPRTVSLPVIMLSARAGEEARVEGLEAGADDYMVKPFTARELLARVSGRLTRADTRSGAEVELRESEARYRHISESAPVMAWVTDPDGRCSFVSKSWYDFTGQTPATALGFGWFDAVHPDDRGRAQSVFLAANVRKEPFRIEYRLINARGGDRWTLDTAVPRFAADGRFLGYIGSVIDISDRKAVEQRREEILAAERAARREVERVSRLKDEFLATLSHELRTPLNAILGWAHVLKRAGPESRDLARGLAAIDRNARVQTQMVEDLLDMSRIVSGKVHVDIGRVVIGEVVDQAIQAVQPAAEARGVTLVKSFDGGTPAVAGDPQRLQQVFWNLLTNAIKFTPRGGEVNVTVARTDSHVEISVVDTGEGIDPDFLPHIFERFRQGDAAPSRKHGGLGLGLSIVKELTERHGGTIRAQSMGKGHGATFTVAFPVPPSDAPAREPAATGEQPALPAGEAASRLDGLRVLVVDDDEDSRELLVRVLHDTGAEVVTAASAADAIEAVKQQAPALIVSDIGMPGEDGYELMRRIRALSPAEGGDVPAIALTAFARPVDRERALGAGFQRHVAKPVNEQELWEAAASLARRRPGPPASASAPGVRE